MTTKQAQFLLKDWGSNLIPEDYCETIRLSIKGVGTKIFNECCYHDSDDYIFIWTKTDSFVIKKKDLGEFVSISSGASKQILVSLRKECNFK